MSERGNCFPFLRKVNGHASGEERNFASPASGYALLKERRKNGPRASVRFSRYRYIGLTPFPALHRFQSVSNSILDFSRVKIFLFFSFFFFETRMMSFSHSRRFEIANFFLREKKLWNWNVQVAMITGKSRFYFLRKHESERGLKVFEEIDIRWLR